MLYVRCLFEYVMMPRWECNLHTHTHSYTHKLAHYHTRTQTNTHVGATESAKNSICG